MSASKGESRALHRGDDHTTTLCPYIRALPAWLFIAALASVGVSADGERPNHNARNARGIYLYSLNVAVEKPPSKAPQVTQALSEPGVDGLTLVENWSAIEPSRGVFQWDLVPHGQSLFDQWLITTLAAGRRINLAIRAGQDIPCWLLRADAQPCGSDYVGSYAGARRWRFTAAAHQGLVNDSCETVDLAVPWDPIFLAEWDAMLMAVSRHLTEIGAYDAVKLVRLTGINRTTDEFRLPEEILPSPCTDADGNIRTETNTIGTWLAAGYRPSLLLQAWDAITASFQRYFPDKTFNVPIIPIDIGQGQYPFPEIDEDGCVYTKIVDPSEWSVPRAIPTDTCPNKVIRHVADDQLNGVLSDLLALAAKRFPRHLVVEFENLDTAQSASSAIVDAAQTLGTMTGYMTNNYFAAVQGAGAGAACSGGFSDPHPCPDSASYLALLDIGIYPCRTNQDNPWCQTHQDLQSEYIEVFAPDILSFPDAILQAHIELHRSSHARRSR